jgi:hypothetical protein
LLGNRTSAHNSHNARFFDDQEPIWAIGKYSDRLIQSIGT